MSEDDDQSRRRWFREEVLPLEPELRAYARRFVVPGEADVEDLVHEVFVRAIATQNWREVQHPRVFAMRILRNLAYDALRRRKIVAIDTVADLEALGIIDGQPGPEAALASREELKELQALVEGLPTMCRRVFTLRKVYDLSPAEIAEQLGISVSTVEKHLAKGLRICAEKLARTKRRTAGRETKGPWRKNDNAS